MPAIALGVGSGLQARGARTLTLHESMLARWEVQPGLVERAGWMSVPLELRDQPGLSEAATHRMAAAAHRIRGTGLDLGPPPERCCTICELLAPTEKGWSRRQQTGAKELARRWTAQGLKVLLACRSPWLKRYLETNSVSPGLAVSVADAVTLAGRRIGVIQFDALIVDEGQDLLDMAMLDRLDGALKGGLGGGRWCFFHDVNNQSGFFGEPDQDALSYLESCGPARVPLTTNCRNTRLILEKVQSSLGADMGVRGTGEGPKP